MISSGEPVSAQKAVASAWPSTPSRPTAWSRKGRRRIEYLQQSGEWKERREQLRQPLGLNHDQMIFAFAVAEGAIKAKTKGQYPAPLVALKAIREGCNLPLEEGLKAEQKAVRRAGRLADLGQPDRHLLHEEPAGARPGRERPDDQAAGRCKHVGVLGTGLMGAGIAAAHARSGIRTAMVDVDDDRLDDGLKRASDVVMSRIKIGRATPEDLANMLAHAQHVDLDQDLRRLRRRHRGDHRERVGQERGLSESSPR